MRTNVNVLKNKLIRMYIKGRFWIFLFFCVLFLSMFSYFGYNLRRSTKLFKTVRVLKDNHTKNYKKTTPQEAMHYSISSSYCKMLDPNPWNESVLKYFHEPPSLSCSKLPLLTFVEQHSNFTNILKIDKKVIAKYKSKPNHSIKCCYSVIRRVEQNAADYNISADNLIKISECMYFKNQTVLKNSTEFILVKCQSILNGSKQGKEVYKDVHAVVPVLPEVASKLNKKEDAEKLNVVILGIDSVSKLNFRRIMPNTVKYMEQNKWVELNGYNKIAENTFPNLMAILSGESMQRLEEICWSNITQQVNDCPFIWNEFEENGYVTLYAEDTPAIATFNLKRTGFVKKPTNYYMRPFMLAAHNLLKTKDLNGLPVCTGPVLVVDHVLNYGKRFLRVFNGSNYFTILWLNSLSHNELNAPGALDASVHNFLTELSNIGTYENSLILVLSDHGIRFGNVRESFLGYLEERMPFVFIWCPEWFRKKYSKKFKNLLINKNRLTSPFDIHVTLKKLLSQETNSVIPFSSACPECNSLFEVQPFNRSCLEASIDLNWCLCSEFRQIPAKEKVPGLIGKYLYQFVVNKTNELVVAENVKKKLCAKWKFLRVVTAIEIMASNITHQYSIKNDNNEELSRYEYQKIDSNTKIYAVVIELHPGKTKFEATVKTNDFYNYSFIEPPKRLDSIFKTSECVENLTLKFFCYCKKKKKINI